MSEKAQTKTVTVKVDEANPMPLNVLAEAIIQVSDAFERIKQSKLSERAVILLLHDLSGVKLGDIKLILHNGPLLKKYFTKKNDLK